MSAFSWKSLGSLEIWDSDDEGLDHFQQSHDNPSREDVLVAWQAESIIKLIKHIAVYRKNAKPMRNSGDIAKVVRERENSGDLARMTMKSRENSASCLSHGSSLNGSDSENLEADKIPLEEVKEVIHLPAFDPTKHKKIKNVDSMIKLPKNVVAQLRNLISRISRMYHHNPFHNFEHACHVVMSVHKILNHIVAPENIDYERKTSKAVATDLHYHNRFQNYSSFASFGSNESISLYLVALSFSLWNHF
jgi:hypothetical protein